MKLTICETFEDAIKRFEKCMPVPVLDLGSFVNRKDGSQTISISDTKFKMHFETKPDGVNTSGIYVFWLLDGRDLFSEIDRTHWVQGKQFAEEKEKLRKIDGQIVEDYSFSKDGEKSKNTYLFFKETWTFKECNGRIPLYIGKSTNVFERLKLHMAWPASAIKLVNQVNNTITRKPQVIKPNTSTQFRSAFEMLITNKKRTREFMYRKIGFSFIPTKLIQMEDRFFWENYLIGKYRPPFNVDSER